MRLKRVSDCLQNRILFFSCAEFTQIKHANIKKSWAMSLYNWETLLHVVKAIVWSSFPVVG